MGLARLTEVDRGCQWQTRTIAGEQGTGSNACMKSSAQQGNSRPAPTPRV